MEYKGHEIKRVDDRNRGWGIFEKGTNKFAWVCSYWTHEKNGIQIAANHHPHTTTTDSKIWIDNGLPVEDGEVLIFAVSQEEAIEYMKDMLSKPKPPVLPPTFLDEYPPELLG